MHGDSMVFTPSGDGDPSGYGDIYVAVRWLVPDDQTISKVRVSGSAGKGHTEIERFDSFCQRFKSTNIRSSFRQIAAESYGYGNQCYIKLKTMFSYVRTYTDEKQDDAERERVKARVSAVELRDIHFDAEVSNRPMRYISWIEDHVLMAMNWTLGPAGQYRSLSQPHRLFDLRAQAQVHSRQTQAPEALGARRCPRQDAGQARSLA